MMTDIQPITVVRLGHRPGRDERTTTHVALVARAFGANRVVLPESAGQVNETVEDVTSRFGGDINVELVGSPMRWLRRCDTPIVHLTMYGIPVRKTLEPIRRRWTDDPLVIAVGGGKVPGDLYDLAEWNVGVTNQPHSEIAALAVFLDRLTDGAALERSMTGGEYVVVPSERGKHVEPRDSG